MRAWVRAAPAGHTGEYAQVMGSTIGMSLKKVKSTRKLAVIGLVVLLRVLGPHKGRLHKLSTAT